MGTISDKTTYLNTTKTLIREKINDLGQNLDTEDTFRSYVEALEQVYEDYPKIEENDVTEPSINNTKAGKMEIDLKGNTEQNGEPTPDNEIPVEVVSGENTVKVVNKNLFDLTNIETQTINGVTFTKNINNSIEPHKEQDFPISLSSRNLFDKNTVMANARIGQNGIIITDITADGYSLSDYILCKPNTSYTGNTVFTNLYDRIAYYDKNKTYLSVFDGLNQNTITTPNNCYYMRFGKQTSQLDTFMLVEGSTVPTEYQPYYNYELCKIGDYQDYIYKNKSINKWYIHSLFQKIVFDNDSQFWTGSSSADGYARVGHGNSYDIGFKGNNIIGVYCNKFKGLTQNENTPSLTGQHWYVSNADPDRFRIMFRSGDSSLTEKQLATLIKTSGVYIYCFRKNEIDIEITDTTLISQLNALEKAKSYDNVTNIIQENNDLPFILDIKTLKKS